MKVYILLFHHIATYSRFYDRPAFPFSFFLSKSVKHWKKTSPLRRLKRPPLECLPNKFQALMTHQQSSGRFTPQDMLLTFFLNSVMCLMYFLPLISEDHIVLISSSGQGPNFYVSHSEIYPC